MTIEQIKYQIKELQNELERKEKEIENRKDDIVGEYYKRAGGIGKV